MATAFSGSLTGARQSAAVERAFRASWTLEENHQLFAVQGGKVLLGRDPYTDLRNDLTIMARGFDEEGLSHILQHSDDTGHQTHALAVRLHRVIGVGDQPAILLQYSFQSDKEVHLHWLIK